MKRKIKILYLANDLTIGGAEEIYLIFSKYLDKKKFDLLFVVIGEMGVIGNEVRKNSPTIFLKIPGRPLSLINKIKAVKKISDICKEFKPDLIHSQLWTSNLLARIVGKLNNTPVIISEQNVYIDRSKRRLYLDWFLSHFTKKIIAVSPPVKDFICNIQKISEKKIIIIPNSFDSHKFIEHKNSLKRELKIPNSIPVIISVGMLGRLKNQKLILEALSQIKSKYVMLFVGDGPEKQSLKNLTKKLRLNKKVIFLGWRRDMSQLLSISDIFLLSSYTEGLSIALMEAMYMRKVCIVSDIKSNRILINPKNGILFNPNSSSELARKLERILINKNLWGLLGKMVRNKIVNNFSMEIMLRKYEELYQNSIKI